MSIVRDDAYYENMDKRTREYKEWKELKEKELASDSVNGLGDVVEKITEATGIKKAVKAVFGEDCGCDGRKEALNEMLPFGVKAVNCASEEDYNYLKSFFSRRRTRIDRTQQERLADIYNFVYGKNMLPPVGCQGCSHSGFLKAVKKLEMYYNSSNINTSLNEEEE